MYKEIILDTRELEAPEPIMEVVNNLSLLNDTSYIKMIHRMEPKMLYKHLKDNDFYYKINIQNGDFHIFICKNSFKDKEFFEGL